MNIEHLSEFVELSRQLNFTATAKTLHMTQPALSNHVRALEREVGAQLIERSTKGHPRLTPAGQLFLEAAQQIVGLHQNALAHIRDLQRAVEGQVVVRTPRNEYGDPLLDYIFEFRRDHPNVDVVMRPWVDIDGHEDVATGSVDCAYVGYGDPVATPEVAGHTIAYVPYAMTEVCLWVDRSHPLATNDALDVHNLDGYSLVVPANKKRDSWILGIQNIVNRYSLGCTVEERYCDSLEDLLLTKIQPADLMLCDRGLLSSAIFRVRGERMVRPFAPTMCCPVSLAYLADTNNVALQRFVDVLASKLGNLER